MNQNLSKNIMSGLISGVVAAIICTAISAAMTRVFGSEISLARLVLGGLTVAAITFLLTLVIGGIIRYAKS